MYVCKCIYVCICVGLCTCVYMYMCGCGHPCMPMYTLEVNIRCLPASLPTSLRQALPLHLELINSARLAPESSCFPLAPSSGVTDTHAMTDFMWALEIQSQVLVLLQQALNQLSLLSSTVIAAF